MADQSPWHRVNNNNGEGGQRTERPYRSNNESRPVGFVRQAPKEPTDFEDKLKQFMQSSDSKLSELRYRMGDTQQIFFDQLGIDFLAVDEADKFRRLPTFTRTEGFSLGESKRATDLQLKVEHIARQKHGQPHRARIAHRP